MDFMIKASHLMYKVSQTLLVFFFEEVIVNGCKFFCGGSENFANNLFVDHYI